MSRNVRHIGVLVSGTHKRDLTQSGTLSPDKAEGHRFTSQRLCWLAIQRVKTSGQRFHILKEETGR